MAWRRLFHLDKPGARVEAVARPEDGVIELRPQMSIPVDQAWYWTEEWQAKEREADLAIAEGRTTKYNSGEEFLAALRARA